MMRAPVGNCDERLGRDLVVSLAYAKAKWARNGRLEGTAFCATCGGRFSYRGRTDAPERYLIHNSHCTCPSEIIR